MDRDEQDPRFADRYEVAEDGGRDGGIGTVGPGGCKHNPRREERERRHCHNDVDGEQATVPRLLPPTAVRPRIGGASTLQGRSHGIFQKAFNVGTSSAPRLRPRTPTASQKPVITVRACPDGNAQAQREASC